MKLNASKLVCVISLLAAAFCVGCGGSSSGGDDGFLDEVGDRYRVNSVSFSDADEDDVLTIDIARQECDDNITVFGGGNFGFDSLEPYTDVLATVSLDVDAEAAGVWLTGYTIEYIPRESATGNPSDPLGMPPELADLFDQGSNRIFFPQGSSSTFTITCLTIDTKEEFFNASGWTSEIIPIDEDGDGDTDFAVLAYFSPEIDISRYTIRIRLEFEDQFGYDDRDITIERTIYLSDYDNC